MTNTDITVTKPPKESTTKKMATVIMTLILILVMIMVSVYIVSRNKSISQSQSSKLYPIYTDKWTEVEVNGKEADCEIQKNNDIKPKYLIAINNTSNPIELPSKNLVDLGKNITKIYLSLIPNQGITSAEVLVKIK